MMAGRYWVRSTGAGVGSTGVEKKYWARGYNVSSLPTNRPAHAHGTDPQNPRVCWVRLKIRPKHYNIMLLYNILLD